MWALLIGLMAVPARAQDLGVPVTLEVRDAARDILVPTATVTSPLEGEPHAVNTETARWTDSVLYLPDGSELVFERRMEVTFEVSAPGYLTERVTVRLRRRRNRFIVPLTRSRAPSSPST